MKRVKLGTQGPWVSEICFGSLAVSPLQGRVSWAEGQDVFRYGCELGIDWVDTAEIYENYGQLAPVLAEFPHVKVVSKSYAVTAEEMDRSLVRARQGLGRDVIDIFLLHEQEGMLTLRGHEGAWQRLCRAQEAQEVGWIGISTHTVAGVREGCLFPGMQIIQPILNFAGLGIVGGTLEDMTAAIRLAHEVGIGLYAMKVFGGGHLGGAPREALDFVRGMTEVPAMALGMSSRAEVEHNIRYVSDLPLGDHILDKIGKHERRLHIAEWCDGCGRCVGFCPSKALSVGGSGCQEQGQENPRGSERKQVRVRVDSCLCVLCGYCGRACPHFCLKIV
ncbi:MAG: aldo/keto reductase [Peptococcaceae bacterium]|nr:aldo/keto reductase [Peptococcaceae bacterium]